MIGYTKSKIINGIQLFQLLESETNVKIRALDGNARTSQVTAIKGALTGREIKANLSAEDCAKINFSAPAPTLATIENNWRMDSILEIVEIFDRFVECPYGDNRGKLFQAYEVVSGQGRTRALRDLASIAGEIALFSPPCIVIQLQGSDAAERVASLKQAIIKANGEAAAGTKISMAFPATASAVIADVAATENGGVFANFTASDIGLYDIRGSQRTALHGLIYCLANFRRIFGKENATVNSLLDAAFWATNTGRLSGTNRIAAVLKTEHKDTPGIVPRLTSIIGTCAVDANPASRAIREKRLATPLLQEFANAATLKWEDKSTAAPVEPKTDAAKTANVVTAALSKADAATQTLAARALAGKEPLKCGTVLDFAVKIDPDLDDVPTIKAIADLLDDNGDIPIAKYGLACSHIANYFFKCALRYTPEPEPVDNDEPRNEVTVKNALTTRKVKAK